MSRDKGTHRVQPPRHSKSGEDPWVLPPRCCIWRVFVRVAISMLPNCFTLDQEYLRHLLTTTAVACYGLQRIWETHRWRSSRHTGGDRHVPVFLDKSPRGAVAAGALRSSRNTCETRLRRYRRRHTERYTGGLIGIRVAHRTGPSYRLISAVSQSYLWTRARTSLRDIEHPLFAESVCCFQGGYCY